MAAELGDHEARRRLVEACLPAIVALAGTFRRTSRIERRELVQEGIAGLLLATRRFDPSLGTPFWAYASYWVRKAMQELVADLARPVALSDRAVRVLATVRAARADHLRQHGAEPTTEELSRSTGLPQAQIERLQAAERTPHSLEERVDQDGVAVATVGERIADPQAEWAFDDVLDDIEVGEVRALTDLLDDRERLVIRQHFGLDEPAQTLRGIATGLGVTAERVRQIEAGALAKLRASLARPAVAVPNET
ncbi:sigma-70 family RNA polymerase sigma factor [Geodermatophilus tzadiensis]|uniref:sigma-70 family RNA polymerase sigma factor n=1 Tax=Geodermatophilus tzadiensis TaxID=1137988 RepID=UPI001475AE97|nr:sigma-70 family RNA polymerase sigma factor [Geodermatophilus tzadiensis]